MRSGAAFGELVAHHARNQILAWPLEIGQMWGDPDLMNTNGLNVWRVDSVQSVVFDQAENRLHIQKAIMVWLVEASRVWKN